MRPCVEFGFPSLSRDSKQRGKLGSDVGAPRAALYLCMRKCGKPADGPRSPMPFSNRIRHTAGDTKQIKQVETSQFAVDVPHRRASACLRPLERLPFALPFRAHGTSAGLMSIPQRSQWRDHAFRVAGTRFTTPEAWSRPTETVVDAMGDTTSVI